MSITPDFRKRSLSVNIWIVGRNASVFQQTQDLSKMVGQRLGAVAKKVAFTHRDKKVSIFEQEPATKMIWLFIIWQRRKNELPVNYTRSIQPGAINGHGTGAILRN